MAVARIRALSCGLWKPVLFSEDTKSQRKLALRCSWRASFRSASLAPAAWAALMASMAAIRLVSLR